MRGFARRSKFDILREKTVAGMDRIRPALPGDFQDQIGPEIGFVCRRRPQSERFIGVGNMQAGPIGIGVDRDRGNSQFFAGANNPQSDLTAIGDQDFLDLLQSSTSSRVGINQRNESSRIRSLKNGCT